MHPLLKNEQNTKAKKVQKKIEKSLVFKLKVISFAPALKMSLKGKIKSTKKDKKVLQINN